MIKVIRDPDSGEITKFIECSSCEGLGYYNVYINEYDLEDHPCRNCEGKGELEIHD